MQPIPSLPYSAQERGHGEEDCLLSSQINNPANEISASFGTPCHSFPARTPQQVKQSWQPTIHHHSTEQLGMLMCLRLHNFKVTNP